MRPADLAGLASLFLFSSGLHETSAAIMLAANGVIRPRWTFLQ
jgi:hypothetical protein